jgi:DMSO/TMAO reductase YedYZ molybdopterin-dependent catalytic subunit
MPLTRRQFFTSLVRASHTSAPPEVAAIPTAQFFRQYTHPTPRLNADHWSFSIGGQVRLPLSLSYADLLALPAVDLPCTLVCAAHRPGDERIGHAVWRGVPMATLLDQIIAPPDATYARLEAAGGDRATVPLEMLRGGLLAYAMNGEPLTPAHGFPARLLIPGLYDHQQPRWIERVELWNRPGPRGLWEQRGWTASTIQTTSAFEVPAHLIASVGPVALGGYAFAGSRRITRVEVSVDGGAWVPAALGPSQPNVWTRWTTRWPAPVPGDYQLRVRASDDTGFTQPDDAPLPYPNGSSAIHTITAHITAGSSR